MLIPLEDRSEVAKNLETEKALKVIPIADDHNCVFRCLAHVVFEGEDRYHADVRDAVCNELQADPDEVYSQRFTPRTGDYKEDGSYAGRVTRMRNLEEWGGEPELAAAAKIFGLKIHIHHPVFLPMGVQVIQAPAEEKDVEDVDVHLVYYGDHYDVAYHVDASGVGIPRRYKPRGESATGRRLSSIQEEPRPKVRLPGLGLSKSAM
jgi:hypothetical protein